MKLTPDASYWGEQVVLVVLVDGVSGSWRRPPLRDQLAACIAAIRNIAGVQNARVSESGDSALIIDFGRFGSGASKAALPAIQLLADNMFHSISS